jgi:hypothetical protein
MEDKFRLILLMFSVEGFYSNLVYIRKNLSDICPQSQLRILLMLLYLSVSQHVSAPTGHPQENTITI